MNNNNSIGIGHVYFIQLNGMPGVVKIGLTKNLKKRISNLGTASPYGVTLIGSIKTPDPESLEKMLHFKYKSLRLNGEWFRLDEDDVIKELDRHNSRPSNLMHLDLYFYDWSQFNKYIGKKVYNQEFCESFKEYINSDAIDNRSILRRLQIHCDSVGLVLKKSRDHSGRYFIIID